MGCPSKSGQTTETTAQKEDLETITAKDIENLEYTEYALSPEAKVALQGWQRYQELLVQLEFLKKGDFAFFGGENEILINFINELKINTPVELQSPGVKERLIVLETKLLKFHSTLKLSNASKKELLQDIKDVLVATSNLHLQINKKFEFESQVIEDPSPEIAPER